MIPWRGLSVCSLPVTFVYCAKTAEQIEMKFGTGTWGDTGNIVLDGVAMPLFWGELGVGEFLSQWER